MSHSHTRQTRHYVRKSYSRPIGLRSGIHSIFHLYDLAVIWTCRWQERQHLREMDDRLLKDIGLSPEDVRHEIRKPFWRG